MSNLLLNKLFLILLLGFVLRVYGLTHGFPFIYNIDEPALVRSATGIRFDINPGHFDWPHFHFYLNYALFMAVYYVRAFLNIVGLRAYIEPYFPLFWRDPLIFYFVARLFNAFLGTLTIIPVFLIAFRLFGKKVALFSALAFALFPHHVHASHFALIDVPMVFWFTWSLYFASRMMGNEKHSKWNLPLSAVFAGLAASTKYNGGFALAVLIFVLLLKIEGRITEDLVKDLIGKVITAVLLFLLAFFVTTPFAVLDYDTFSIKDSPKGAFWQFTNVGKVGFKTHLLQISEASTTKFLYDFGPALLIMVWLYVFLCFKEKSKNCLLIALPFLFYFIYVSSFSKNRIHYYMLTYPFMSIMMAFMAEKLLNGIRRKTSSYVAVVLLVSIAFTSQFVLSLNKVRILAAKDNRNIVFEWLSSHLLGSEKVLFYGSDFDPVIEKFKGRSTKIRFLSQALNPDYKAKYLAVASSKELSEFEEVSLVSGKYKRLLYLSGDGNLGPDVFIFELGER